MPHLTDEQFRYYEDRRNVADFAESVYNDPKTNKEMKRVIKKKFPNLQIADIDAEDKLEARFAEDKKARDEEKRIAKEKLEDEEWKKERERVQKEYGFTKEAMEKLDKLMLEKKIGDYDVGATYMASKEPKPIEPANTSRFWRHDQQEGFAEMAKDPEKWAEREILNAIRRDEANQKAWR